MQKCSTKLCWGAMQDIWLRFLGGRFDASPGHHRRMALGQLRLPSVQGPVLARKTKAGTVHPFVDKYVGVHCAVRQLNITNSNLPKRFCNQQYIHSHTSDITCNMITQKMSLEAFSKAQSVTKCTWQPGSTRTHWGSLSPPDPLATIGGSYFYLFI